jgi:hypothetical protein
MVTDVLDPETSRPLEREDGKSGSIRVTGDQGPISILVAVDLAAAAVALPLQ